MSDISDPETAHLFSLMGEPFVGETYLQDGWVYRDPSKMTSALWNEFLGIIGEGNYRLMSHAKYHGSGEVYERGQLLISPAGMDNLTSHVKKKAN